MSQPDGCSENTKLPGLLISYLLVKDHLCCPSTELSGVVVIDTSEEQNINFSSLVGFPLLQSHHHFSLLCCRV